MPRTLRADTLAFLECLFESAIDVATISLNPCLKNFSSTRNWEDFDLNRKLRDLAARGVISLPSPADPRTVRLTEAGARLLHGGMDPEPRWARAWDGRWRMVLFDVAEQERPVRTKLRSMLAGARLGCLQRSVWISPDSLEALRADIRKLTANPGALLFFDGRPSAGESDAALVAGAWNFDRINAAYRAVMELDAAPPATGGAARTWHHWMERERTAWSAAIGRDPFLPEALHPPGYLGPAAHRAHRAALRRAAGEVFPR